MTVDAVERVNHGLTDGDLAASLHKTLGPKVSPTMAAGISDHLWTPGANENNDVRKNYGRLMIRLAT